MQPTVIPDHKMPSGAYRKVYAAPDGDLFNERIGPVEVAVVAGEGFRVLIALDDDDIAKLAETREFWLIFETNWLPVFSFDLSASADAAS